MGVYGNELLSNDTASDWIANAWQEKNIDIYIKSALDNFIGISDGIDVNADEFVDAVNEFSEYINSEISSGREIFSDSGTLLKNEDEIYRYSVGKILAEYEESTDHCFVAVAAMETLVAFLGMPSEEFTGLTQAYGNDGPQFNDSELNEKLSELVELALLVHEMLSKDPLYKRCFIYDEFLFNGLGVKLQKLRTSKDH